MTPPRPAVLRNRRALFAAIIFCIYAALPQSMTSLRSLSRSVPLGHDPILICGLVAAIVITVSIAIRSPSLADRIVFGTAAGAFIVWLIKAVVSFGPSATTIINGFVSLLWTLGAVASFVFLISDSRRQVGS